MREKNSSGEGAKTVGLRRQDYLAVDRQGGRPVGAQGTSAAGTGMQAYRGEFGAEELGQLPVRSGIQRDNGHRL